MIALDRRQAGRFRAAARRCVAGRPRGLAPPVFLQQTKDNLLLSAVLGEVAIALHLPAHEHSAVRLVVPWATLDALEGKGGGMATLDEEEAGCLRCRWSERGEARELAYPSVTQQSPQAAWPRPQTMATVDPALLVALHACGQIANRSDNSRYALTRLQLRGRSGDLVGTDGRQLLLWAGFTFPFPDDVLLPAVPIFGGRELAGEQAIRIGRTPQHVIVAAGPWTVWLTVDASARFPDVSAVLSRSSPLARMVIDAAEAKAVLDTLAKGPTTEEEPAPVTLDFGPRPLLCVPAVASTQPVEVELSRSSCWGPATTVTLDRRYLVRALALGLREVRVGADQTPILFRDERRSYLVARLDSQSTAVSDATEQPSVADTPSIRSRPPLAEEPMNPERNGSPSTEHASTDDVLDPLAEAEALRAMLTEIARRVNRLIVSLRQFQKQRRALQTAWTSLQHLHLRPKEGS